MIGLILTGLLATADPVATGTAPVDAPSRTQSLAALPASDLDIRRALLAAHQATPEKSVCVTRTLTGSKQPRQICGTLARWFAARSAGEVAQGHPPSQLVEGIKEERRKAMMRDRAAGARTNRGG